MVSRLKFNLIEFGANFLIYFFPRYTWGQIANLSYKNKTFILDVTVGPNGRKNKNERRYNFETGKKLFFYVARHSGRHPLSVVHIVWK